MLAAARASRSDSNRWIVLRAPSRTWNNVATVVGDVAAASVSGLSGQVASCSMTMVTSSTACAESGRSRIPEAMIQLANAWAVMLSVPRGPDTSTGSVTNACAAARSRLLTATRRTPGRIGAALAITAAGEELLRQAHAWQDESLRTLTAGWPDEDVKTLMDRLVRAQNDIDSAGPAERPI